VRIVVTGATGNIGTALLRRLTAPGSGHSVVGVVRRPPGSGGGRGTDPAYDGVEWHAIDLAEKTALPALREAVRGADAVVHLVWGLQPSRAQRYLMNLDVGGSARVVEAVEQESVGHLVHLSSIGAYSPGPKVRVDESYPTDGIPQHPYSRHKVGVERMLDALEARTPDVVVARIRPTLVMQRAAGSAIARYLLGPLVPTGVLRHLPLLPLDSRVQFQAVHADDVAAALVRVLELRAGGAFNLASEPALTADDVADVLGTKLLHVPAPVLRALMSASWHARLQPVDPAWLDLALAVPLIDTTRARTELGWEPTYDSRAALLDLLTGMVEDAGTTSEALRPRRGALRAVRDELPRLLRGGPIGDRRRP
jgi:UDP-glucose 4-epimerase